jgi:DNA-binding SARP family transcriptional activator
MTGVSVRYTAFGAMSVSVDGVDVPLQRRRERGVLAVLLAAHGAPVAAERLVAEVWGDEAPAQTLASLQVAVSRLRSQLEPERRARTGTRLVSTAAGYSLVAETAEVDTWTFESLADQALRAVDPDERLRLADEARALWSTTPYADCDAPAVRSETTRLEELRLTVEELRARTLLELGRPDETLRDLAVLAPQHPYREPMWSLLALAQYQCSRQADALETLRRLRERLADELGVDPSAEIQQLEQQVLRQDPALAVATRTAPAPPSAPADQRWLSLSKPQAEPAHSPETSSGTVGRDEIVTHAAAVLRGAVDSRSTRFLLVAGEPGIGKSRLATDLGDRARRAGAAVVVGRCHDGDFAPALWPWLGIVRTLVDGLPEGAEQDPLLAPLLEAGVEPDTTGGGTGLRMFDAVVSLIAVAATAQPLLLVLEDIHWADASSLQLLRHLTAAPPQAPVAVLCTRRTTEGTSEGLVDAMAALARAGADRLRLDGLDRDSVRALLDGSVGAHDPSLDDVVAEITAGNPFFVLQYARLLAALPDLAQVDAAALPVPDGIRDVLRQRTRHLPEEAVRTLSSAAVLGHHIDPELVSALTDVPLDQCLDLLDLAMTSGLVEEQDAGYAFVHALARESMYGELSTARRMRLHDRAGRLIEQRRGAEADATAEIAHHAHLSAPLGAEHAERACDWLARAAVVATARHAHPEALELWQQVVADAEPASPAAAQAHRGAAAALIRLGRTDEAHRVLDIAVRIASELGDWTMVAESAAVLSRSGAWSWREHGVEEAPFIELLTEAVAHVAPALQARLLAILQLEYSYGWKSATADEHGVRAVELARTTGDVELLREVMMLRLVASSGTWDTAARLELAEELVTLGPADELGVTALFHLGHARWSCGDPAGADAAIRRSAEAAAELRHSGLEIPLGWWRAARARDLDDPEHDRLMDEVVEQHRRAGYIGSRELECLHSIRRRPFGAPVPEDIVALAGQCVMPVRAVVAHALLESGSPDEAYALLGETVPDDVIDYAMNAGRCLRLLVLSETGTPEEVREALAPLEGHLGAPVSYGSIDHLGVVDHFVAAGLAALGDHRGALTHARAAVELNEQLQCLPWKRRAEALVARLS